MSYPRFILLHKKGGISPAARSFREFQVSEHTDIIQVSTILSSTKAGFVGSDRPNFDYEST